MRKFIGLTISAASAAVAVYAAIVGLDAYAAIQVTGDISRSMGAGYLSAFSLFGFFVGLIVASGDGTGG